MTDRSRRDGSRRRRRSRGAGHRLRALATRRWRQGHRLLGAAAAIALALACGHAAAQDAATATSAADVSGMDQLIAAAQAEGELNVIALPPDWANYGAMIETFAEKYGIEVNSAQPDASSQDEINAANQLRGQGAPPTSSISAAAWRS